MATHNIQPRAIVEVETREGVREAVAAGFGIGAVFESEFGEDRRFGAIIVSDTDGFILGMANYPTFNPNEYNKVPKEEEARLKNVAVTDVYEPGSVFKIVPAAAALEERLITASTVIDCGVDRVTLGGRVLKLPAEDHAMGRLSVAEVISHSSNRGSAADKSQSAMPAC